MGDSYRMVIVSLGDKMIQDQDHWRKIAKKVGPISRMYRHTKIMLKQTCFLDSDSTYPDSRKKHVTGSCPGNQSDDQVWFKTTNSDATSRSRSRAQKRGLISGWFGSVDEGLASQGGQADSVSARGGECDLLLGIAHGLEREGGG